MSRSPTPSETTSSARGAASSAPGAASSGRGAPDAGPLPGGADAGPLPGGVDPDVARVEAALTTLVRRVKLPATHARIAAAAEVALDRAASIVLLRIDEWGPLRLSDLAERLDVDASTASRHVKRLEDDGYVVRTADPDDGRASLLSLSDPGRDVVRRLVAARRAWVAQVLDGWSSSEREKLGLLLERFVSGFTALGERGGT